MKPMESATKTQYVPSGVRLSNPISPSVPKWEFPLNLDDWNHLPQVENPALGKRDAKPWWIAVHGPIR